MRILIAILAIALASTAAPTASAADGSRFTSVQRELIEAFARDQARTAAAVAQRSRDAALAAQDAEDARDPQRGPNGKHGRSGKGLPPGIAMNLERGKALPPGIAKQQLPETLAKTLPPATKGKEIAVVDGRVLLIDTATQRVLDRIENVLLR